MTDMAESTDDCSEYQWPLDQDMASASSIVEAGITADTSASEPHLLQSVEIPEKQLHYEVHLPVVDKQAIVPVDPQAMEDVEEAEVGREKELLPDGANLIEALFPVEVVEMDTHEGPALVLAPSGSSGRVAATRDATKAGYDCFFLDLELASEYNCSICLSVSRDPQQTKCCGSTFCLYCIQQALASSKVASCPNCNHEPVELIPDKAQKQKINKLKVSCPLEGCTWIVELADIETHMRVLHPLSPPQLGHQGNNCPRQQYYNTLPAKPRSKEQQLEPEKAKTGKRPVPTPRVPASRSTDVEKREYVNLAVLQPEAAQTQPLADGAKDDEPPAYLNLTLTRPRNRPESSLPESKRQKVAPGVHTDSGTTSPPLPVKSNQEEPIQDQNNPLGDQMVPLHDQTQLATRSLSDAHTTVSNEIYENVAFSVQPCTGDDNQTTLPSEAPVPSTAEETSHSFNVVLRPRVPRECSFSPPAVAEPCKTVKLSETVDPTEASMLLSPSDLSPVEHQDEICAQPDQIPQHTSLQTESTVGSPPPSLPSSPPLPMANSQQYVNLESPDAALPSLPPELLALLNNPTSPPPNQLEDTAINISPPPLPLSSPQLQTYLLTLPEQLLNMIQPLSDENKSPSPDPDRYYENAPFSPSKELPDVEYVNTAAVVDTYVEVSPNHEQSEPDTPPHNDESTFEYVPMSPQHEDSQPSYVEVPHHHTQPEVATDSQYVPVPPPPRSQEALYVEVHPQQSEVDDTAADYVPMTGQPDETLQGDYVEVGPVGERSSMQRARANSSTSESSEAPLLQDQPEYEDVPHAPPDGESTETVPQLPQPTAAEVVADLPQAQPAEENYATIPAATGDAEYSTEHIYEPLPPARSPSSTRPPEEPDQAVYADIPEPLPPPGLPPRLPSRASDTPAAHVNVSYPAQPPDPTQPPELPPRSASQPPPEPQGEPDSPPLQSVSPTTQPPPSATPQPQQDQEVPTGVETVPPTTTDPTLPEPRSQIEEQVAVLDHILQDLLQGSANEHTELSPHPPQYDDLSQAPRYTELVQSPAVELRPLQAAAPRGEVFIIRNANADAQPQQAALRTDNVNIQYAMGDRDHHRNKNTRKTQTLL